MTAWIRRASGWQLALLAMAAAAAMVAGIALSSRSQGGAASPPPISLAELRSRLAGQRAPAGMQAHITLSDNLLPTETVGGEQGQGSPLLNGGSGRLWWSGPRLRLQLSTGLGDTEILIERGSATLYDTAAGAAYRLRLPAGTGAGGGLGGGALAAAGRASRPTPAVVAGRPAYRVTLHPRDAATRVAALELALDARTGAPLAASVRGRGERGPALSVSTSDVRYGPIASSAFDVSLPADLPTFSVAAPGACPLPARSGGLPRTGCVGLRSGASIIGRTAVYGHGIGAAVAVQTPENGGPDQQIFSIFPSVDIGGVAAQQLVTEIGTLVRVVRGATASLVVSTLPPRRVQAVARGL